MLLDGAWLHAKCKNTMLELNTSNRHTYIFIFVFIHIYALFFFFSSVQFSLSVVKGPTLSKCRPPSWCSQHSSSDQQRAIISSVQFSHSAVSDSLQPHEPQHARPPCPSPTPGVHPNPCPLSWWCHPTISSSVVPFSSCPQSFPASGSFPMSQFFSSGGQSIGVSASASVLLMNIQDWFHLGLTGLISSQSKELSRTFSKYLNSKASILQCSAFFMVQLSHPHIIWHLCQQCDVSAF